MGMILPLSAASTAIDLHDTHHWPRPFFSPPLSFTFPLFPFQSPRSPLPPNTKKQHIGSRRGANVPVVSHRQEPGVEVTRVSPPGMPSYILGFDKCDTRS